MTYLELINGVLTRLREETVATPTETDYSTMIGALVNEVKREVENSWRWVALNKTIQITTSATDYEYDLTASGDNFTLKRVFNTTTNRQLMIADSRWLSDQIDITPRPGEPFYFAVVNSVTTSEDYQVELYPNPNAVYVIDFDVYANQAELSTGTTVLAVPAYPVLLGAYYRAVVERGEDGGMMAAEAYRHYQNSLSDAIAFDAQKVITGTHDWRT